MPLALLPLALLLANAQPAPASPADAAARLVAARPAAVAVRAAGGGLAHLSGLAEPPLHADRAESARRFLAREGAAFGVDAASLEAPRVVSSARGGGAAVFRRLVDGRPVFGGEVAVGWRADGAITVVNGSPRLAAERRGAHRIDAAAAVDAALAAAPFPAGEVAGEPGWLEADGGLVPVVRVAHGGARDASYTFVDAGTGAVLWRASRVRHLLRPACTSSPCIETFLASPLAPPPAGAAGNAAERFALAGVAPGATTLTGQRTAAFNCAGYDWLAGDFPRACEAPRFPAPLQPPVGGQTSLADAQGSFLATPDPTQIDPRDPFAEQSAYFHVDAHGRFLDALDPGFAARTAAGGVGFVPSYVNALDDGAPLDNAFFSPAGGPPGSSGVMIFGQGTLADTAYDAEVLYHELTHAAVEVSSGMQGVVDSLGVNADPDAINEGTADTFAFAHLGEALVERGQPVASASCLSRYFGAALGLDCLREQRNDRTCRGEGPNVGRNPGRTGEVHDDGEIWSGFTWALYEEAAAHGLSRAMAKALFQATLVAGPNPGFHTLAETVRQKVVDAQVAPDPADRLPAEAAAFTACTIARRDLAGCADRALPLYSGERAQGVVYGLLSSPTGTSAAGQQYFVDVPCGAVALRVQTGDAAGSGALYVRRGRPVEFDGPGLVNPRYDWALRGDFAEARLDAAGCAACVACGGDRTALGGGRWYFLHTGETGAVFHLGVSLVMPAGEAAPARPATAMGTCTWGGGPTPAGASAPIPRDPPALACAAPGAVAEPSTCASGGLTPGGGGKAGGCGCSHASAGDALLGLAGLLALRRRSRAGREVRTFEA